MDSKKIGSDKRIRQLADGILKTPGLAANIVLIGPEKYNSLYEKFANLNDLLAWGHARVIENLLTQKPDCKRSLSDKFANERVIQKALLKQGRQIQIDQRTKAESDIAVAAASILARDKFVRWLDTRGRTAGDCSSERRFRGSQIRRPGRRGKSWSRRLARRLRRCIFGPRPKCSVRMQNFSAMG